MEYTDGIFSIDDALPRATGNFFNAVRLSDFKAFSSEKYNAFTYGFQGNNMTYGEAYPQARITAKWIKGFYCGRYFDGDLVLENAVYNNATRLWSFSVASGGGQAVPGISDPETAVIDLAIEGSDDGMTVKFYYRTGGTQTEMDKASGGWTQYATYDNSGTPFYGYPVNKGLLTLTASDLTYPPSAPLDNIINQGQSISVSEAASEVASEDDLQRDYRVVGLQPVGNKKRIVYSCTPGYLTAIRTTFSGFTATPAQMAVAKLKSSGKSIPFKNYLTSFSGASSGDWAIADIGSGSFIDSGQQLNAGQEYYLYLFIRDNDGEFDLNGTAGVIEDPAVFGIGTPSVTAAPGMGSVLLLLESGS